jgi:hypothetical protein
MDRDDALRDRRLVDQEDPPRAAESWFRRLARAHRQRVVRNVALAASRRST